MICDVNGISLITSAPLGSQSKGQVFAAFTLQKPFEREDLLL